MEKQTWKSSGLSMTDKLLELTRRGWLIQSLEWDGWANIEGGGFLQWEQDTGWKYDIKLEIVSTEFHPGDGGVRGQSVLCTVHNGMEPKPHHQNNGQIYMY